MKITLIAKTIATLTVVFAFAFAASAQNTSETEFNAFIKQGNGFYNAKQYQQSIAPYEQAVKIRPASDMANFFLGDAYYNTGQYAKARNAYRKVVELNPNYPNAKQFLADAETMLQKENTVSSTAAGANQTAVRSNGSCDKTIFGASGLPAQFYQTFTYTSYVINSQKYGNTNTKGVGGSLMLGTNGSFDSELTFPGPYGRNSFKKSGTFCLDGDQIVFNYTDSDGKQTMKGTYAFSLSGLQLTIIVPDTSGNGDLETYGLVIKGTETVRRTVNSDGTITIDN